LLPVQGPPQVANSSKFGLVNLSQSSMVTEGDGVGVGVGVRVGLAPTLTDGVVVGVKVGVSVTVTDTDGVGVGETNGALQGSDEHCPKNV